LSGREILHGDSLSELEASLPATFVRVHRSHIVNTAHVRAMKREASGVGVLVLSNGAEIPVSRRVLPKVRVALA
jgi:DNA-binding LytR/AlgR family response regulator